MIERLASQLGRRDEVPNIELAEYLCERKDAAGIQEIVKGYIGSDRAIANDCIKVLYEIGERNPTLVSQYADKFVAHLRSKNNRLAWGSMTALAKIAEINPQPIFENLPIVVAAFETGSVITVDNSISVFAELCKASNGYAETVLPIILGHLQECRPKEVPQHAERASVCFNSNNACAFIEVLEERLPYLATTGQKRVTKLLRTLHDLQED